MRPSDGRSSEPKEFVYKADYIYKNSKKRKATSSYSSIDSSSGRLKVVKTLIPLIAINSRLCYQIIFVPINSKITDKYQWFKN